MTSTEYKSDITLPDRAGVGLKSDHYESIIENKPDIGWFEVHPENYMGAGGLLITILTKLETFTQYLCMVSGFQ